MPRFRAGQVRPEQQVRAALLTTEVSNMAVQRGAADAIDHAGIRLLDRCTLMRTQHSTRSPLWLRLPTGSIGCLVHRQ